MLQQGGTAVKDHIRVSLLGGLLWAGVVSVGVAPAATAQQQPSASSVTRTVHDVARNASKTVRARLLVVYIGEEGKAATVPIR
jgi:hypothetical protein